MTEAEWLACIEPDRMLGQLRGKASDRKLRLFAVACCRRLIHLMRDTESRIAVEVAERFADGLATGAERRAAAKAGYAPGVDRQGWSFGAAGCAVGVPAFHAAERGSGNALLLAVERIPPEVDGLRNRARDEAMRSEGDQQSALLRDIFGNPYCPVAIEPRWQSADTVALARGIYEDRAFDRLPLLADALLDAGCADDQVIDHCRSEGPHVRGCWVVDLVLGKE
jgi:hypothetical protein